MVINEKLKFIKRLIKELERERESLLESIQILERNFSLRKDYELGLSIESN